MRIHKTKTIPARQENVLICIECDLCHEIIKCKGSYNTLETEVRLREGEEFPGGGSGTEIDVDICPNCWREKLIPWLESEGANIEEREWDW